ncbi:hypothetical protein DFP72DRAFT_851677 [Ephemerocybe angulata]|uniref:Uncharacterized protein n=1 Tax=Ephemerocybe angulata TaxID=980116 RepID=A0A8H6M3X2_9AGAR|nr:hypothetical protein DFP72DRAFT_851677 [Tulosesus angulatus]
MPTPVIRLWLACFEFATGLPNHTGSMAELISDNSPLQNLALKLDNMERRLMSGDESALAMGIQYYTGEKLAPGLPEPGGAPPPAITQTLALLVACYRVIDYHLFRSGKLEGPPPRRPAPISFAKQAYAIDDWVKKVNGFRTELPRDYGRGSLPSSSMQSSPDDPPTLVKNLLLWKKNENILKVQYNLYRCALFLAYLCSPSGISDPFTAANAKEFFADAANLPGSDKLSEGELEQISTFMEDSKWHFYFQIPFLSSPLRLIAAADIGKARWTPKWIIQDALNRSNRPRVLKAAEEAVAAAALDVAFSGVNASAALSTAAERLAVILQGTANFEPTWFVLQNNPPSPPVVEPLPSPPVIEPPPSPPVIEKPPSTPTSERPPKRKTPPIPSLTPHVSPPRKKRSLSVTTGGPSTSFSSPLTPPPSTPRLTPSRDRSPFSDITVDQTDPEMAIDSPASSYGPVLQPQRSLSILRGEINYDYEGREDVRQEEDTPLDELMTDMTAGRLEGVGQEINDARDADVVDSERESEEEETVDSETEGKIGVEAGYRSSTNTTQWLRLLNLPRD